MKSKSFYFPLKHSFEAHFRLVRPDSSLTESTPTMQKTKFTSIRCMRQDYRTVSCSAAGIQTHRQTVRTQYLSQPCPPAGMEIDYNRQTDSQNTVICHSRAHQQETEIDQQTDRKTRRTQHLPCPPVDTKDSRQKDTQNTVPGIAVPTSRNRV